MSDPAPARSPPLPVPAASLILLRQGADGVEVLVGHRSLSTRAFPGAIVFPGGKLERQDSSWPCASGDRRLASRYGALREAFEETGLLIDAAGQGPPGDADVATERRRVEAGEEVFFALLQRWGRSLDPERLIAFAHWVTPERAPYRFDTMFFLVEASPYEARAALICAEFDRLNWAAPASLLERESARLISPTRHCLSVLRDSATVKDAVNAARARGLIDGAQVRALRGYRD